MLVEFIIGTAVLFVLLLIFSKKKKPEQEAISSEGGKTGDWTDEQGVRFSLDKETLLKAPANLKEYIIPDGVVTIQSNAFEGCANLKCVSFPNSVKRIGRFVFNKCDSLTEIRIPAGSREKFEKMLPSDWHNKLIGPDASGVDIIHSAKQAEHLVENELNGEKETGVDPSVPDEKDRIFEVGNVQFKMKYVSGGTFIMGEGNPEVISHKVTLDHDFWIGETPVTQALWKAVMGNNPSNASLDLDNAPVGNVSWQDCEKFLDKLRELTNQSFFFPTEAQWEFAARGGILSKGYKYSGSNNIDEVAWYWDNCDKKVHSVKTKNPNELGIFDMSGLSWEWCYDWAAEYDVEDDYNPIGPDMTDTLNFLRKGIKNKIIRGGCMENNAPACATTARGQLHPSQKHPLVGLRLQY